MKRFKLDEFLNDLKLKTETILRGVSNTKNAVDKTFSDIHDSILSVVNMHAPFKRVKKQTRKFKEKPWITRRLLSRGKEKDRLYVKALRTQDSDMYNNYKQVRNKLNHDIKLAEKRFIRIRISAAKNKSKVMWKIINGTLHTSTKKSKKSISKLKDASRGFIYQSSDIANTFNDYFVNIGKNMSNTIPEVSHTIHSPRVTSSFVLFEILEEEISKLIHSLDEHKSSRDDDIPVKFLKLSCPVIAPVLADIFNRCILLGVYPSLLKTAKVIPLYKKGQLDERSNYRPISLLMHLNKIFEKVIHQRLYNFLRKFDVLDRNQYGFRKKHSTASAIYDLIENKLKNLDGNLNICALYMDLSKAFDTVNHKILLEKLDHYGIRGIPLQLIKSYLSNRKQYTVVNGHKSEKLLIDIGVPQGSVLGPLFFILYINDLPYASSLVTKLYADDTCLIFSAKTVDELQIVINSEVNKIQNWMSSNKLSINYSKTKYMLINRRNDYTPFSLYINDHKIEQVHSIKYLGIHIDDKLNWKQHIKYVEGKISSACGAIYRLRQTLDQNFLRTFYFAHAYFHLQYSVLAWCNITKDNLQRLNSLHGKLVRLMTLHGPLKDFYFSANEMFKNMDLLRLDDIYQLELAKFMHRAYANDLPQNFNIYFTRIEDMHKYNLRSIKNKTFYSKASKTKKYRQWITNSGVDLWQKIPAELKTLSLNAFSKQYKDTIVDAY